MIEQKYKQDGMFQETKSSSLFPKIADLVLVFFPSPGVFIRDTLKVPSDFFAQTVASYEANGERFENMYVFLPAVLQSQYDAGHDSHGIVYEEGVLRFSPDLAEALSKQSLTTIEHRFG
ncbi:TPA: hypothetical protein NJ328_004894 [Vibrio parahaemolyticus]|uniref:hypothetical protein n=1 Tax=Vibrio parahaemolyticus TaxID=670 RepID=UPI00084B12BA|nr:hypothetical protein [Vibrio parahaemolyticus]EGR2232202.1 hypothetical protein [Vibrio parahaemolyticus]MCS0016487.1 hypothetical protein [Vibrio parahaemolyticus]MCX8779092.1 hypothetical protein [Vibrio parahaemolyticus]MDF4377002.1 hypothetical protein [Vibrio parahaemolyticus]ODY78071.1 hypothetical protein BBM29_09620 [Vibrio parahaemolyticus]